MPHGYKCREGETPEEATKRYMREYRAAHRAQLSEYERVRSANRRRDSPEYRQAANNRARRWAEKMGKEYIHEQAHERTRELKKEVVAAYGGKCTCCGEDNWQLLTIHHIDGEGAAHRKSLFGSRTAAGNRFYRWLKAQGFPKDNFELNCWNCNLGKELNHGICPHQARRAQAASA
jgi:hypothetical protein